jgi:hypothetical protein
MPAPNPRLSWTIPKTGKPVPPQEDSNSRFDVADWGYRPQPQYQPKGGGGAGEKGS